MTDIRIVIVRFKATPQFVEFSTMIDVGKVDAFTKRLRAIDRQDLLRIDISMPEWPSDLLIARVSELCGEPWGKQP